MQQFLIRITKTPYTLLIGVFLTVAFDGCCTTLTLQKARGQDLSYKNQKGKTVVDIEKPQPAAYALLPVAVVGDVLTLPFWIYVTVAVNLGLMKPGM